MRVLDAGLLAHLKAGATTLARCWRITRSDGVVQGFTDHDRDLGFGGVVYRASTGLDATALQQTTGLSVDNAEATGALSDFSLTDTDIRAGRYDGAEVVIWLVNWNNPAERVMQFRGSLGEIRRAGGVFKAELRGLSEALNQPVGRAYHRDCSAVLGDSHCRFNPLSAGYFTEFTMAAADSAERFELPDGAGFEDGWFEGGRLLVLSGAAKGLSGMVRRDRFEAAIRRVELWQALAVTPAKGDRMRLEAGCDKRPETCRLKFHNFLNYRGFPNIPGEDWAMSYPVRSGQNNGGSLSQ